MRSEAAGSWRRKLRSNCFHVEVLGDATSEHHPLHARLSEMDLASVVWTVADILSTPVTQTVLVRAKCQRHCRSVTGNGSRVKLCPCPMIPSSSRSPTVRFAVYLRLPGRGAVSQRVLDPLVIHCRRIERPTIAIVAKSNPDHLFASWVILGRLIEMKHPNPNCLVHVLLCRVGHPFQCGVVVNVPASLHGVRDAQSQRANPLTARR